MDTTVVSTDTGGRQFNRYGQQLIACKHACGRLTTMLGTQECDPCHELRIRIPEGYVLVSQAELDDLRDFKFRYESCSK